ncbi:curli assembly protein CsgF [Moraxellaceae bacterium AER2_44_116]|nr:curli assembly protein CsgF [Moraxellaceae bacterium]TQC95726.1 curli assembly protein CsgF [Moraxellaceae bacterium AER2_44_116]
MMKQKVLCSVILMLPVFASAGPLVYYPMNPSFGGNPGYGSVLLNEAQVQDQHKAPVVAKTPVTALDTFNKRLQTALINRLSSNIISSVVNGTGKIEEGTTETTDFIIKITDIGSGLLNITTTAKATGQTQSFEFDQNAENNSLSTQ